MYNFTVVAKEGIAIIRTSYKSKKKLKVILKFKDKSINYDIIDRIIVPLTFGSGEYTFSFYEQVIGNKYQLKDIIKKTIILRDSKSYTLKSNSYVPYDENSNFYKTALELETIENIKNYIVKNFHYDYVAAVLNGRKSFSIPDIEKCFINKKGTCYEFAALATAMFRICKISAILVVGTVNSNPHAWVKVDDKIFDPTAAIIHDGKSKKYVAQRYY